MGSGNDTGLVSFIFQYPPSQCHPYAHEISKIYTNPSYLLPTSIYIKTYEDLQFIPWFHDLTASNDRISDFMIIKLDIRIPTITWEMDRLQTKCPV